MQLRQMTRAELNLALDWAAAEGWNPGLEDAAAFHATDPAGYFVAEVGGAPVAAISVVNHSDALAFLGLYLCVPEHRGKGIGLALWRHALAHAGDRTVGLDGVPAQQANYMKSGFVRAGETRRFAGRVPPRGLDALRPATQADLDALIGLDGQAGGYARPGFLRLWLGDTPTRRTLVCDGEGFVTVRMCRDGAKIGPLVARTEAGALALLHGASEAVAGVPLMIDLPDDATALSAYCDGLGLTVSFGTARMYRGTAPIPGNPLRAVATLELG